MKITVNKDDIRKPRKTWGAFNPTQRSHGKKGYVRPKGKEKNWRNYE